MLGEWQWFTVEEAAEYLRVSKRTIYRWLHDGLLLGYRAARPMALSPGRSGRGDAEGRARGDNSRGLGAHRGRGPRAGWALGQRA